MRFGLLACLINLYLLPLFQYDFDSLIARDARNAKKKQKREAQLSRAADVELAEISLEQQVLQQLTQRRLSLVTSIGNEGAAIKWVDQQAAFTNDNSTNVVRNHCLETIFVINHCVENIS
jgi:hypothetical protein